MIDLLIFLESLGQFSLAYIICFLVTTFNYASDYQDEWLQQYFPTFIPIAISTSERAKRTLRMDADTDTGTV